MLLVSIRSDVGDLRAETAPFATTCTLWWNVLPASGVAMSALAGFWRPAYGALVPAPQAVCAWRRRRAAWKEMRGSNVVDWTLPPFGVTVPCDSRRLEP